MSIAMIWDHLSLVLSALILAVAAGVPLGLLAYLFPKIGKILLWVVDLIQTIPALALLGVIMVAAGPGSPTAMTGLALYSLLPIARNCTLGLSQVPGHLKEAAAGMGMSPAYRLLHVDVPLAAPMLVTGIRIAAVNAIGTAVFASFVGGGGLGGLFYTAIRQRNMEQILMGTLILMAMALVLDAGLGWVERRMSGNHRNKLPLPVKAAGGALLALASVALVASMLLPKYTEGQLTLYDGDYSEVKLMHAMAELLVGTLVSMVLAAVYNFMIFAVDYSRTEYLQFQDDDYYYYVKAVPKITVSAPDVKVQKINSAKKKRREFYEQ